jgi:hypothetical protein
MVEPIFSRSGIDRLGTLPAAYSEGASKMKQPAADQLSSCKERPGMFSRYLVQPCSWLYDKFLFILSKVLCCFDLKLEKKNKIKKLDGQLRLIRSLKAEYESKKSDTGLTNEAFKEWWKEKFEGLDYELQKRFYIQGIMTLWVSSTAKWPEMDATNKYNDEEDTRSAIADFIRDLKIYQLGFRSAVNPKDEILTYFPRIESSLLQKMHSLKK